MKRCSLPTSLRQRAALPRPPWIHSRLPPAGRGFSLATRLAKDHDVEPSSEPKPTGNTETAASEPKPTRHTETAASEPKHDQKPETKKRSKKDEAKASSKDEAKHSNRKDETKASSRKTKGGQDGGEDHKKTAESKDRSGASRKRKEAKAGTKESKQGGEQDGEAGTEGLQTHTPKVRPRRVRSRVNAPSAPGSLVEKKIAQMRREIDAINRRNRQLLGDVPATEVPTKSPKKASAGKSLKEALLGANVANGGGKPQKSKKQVLEDDFAKLDIKHLNPEELDFQPVDYAIPPVPRLSYGLDRVLFNPGIYRLQDPRSRVYNFDPYLEKIMSVSEFNFSALSEYKTSSKDEELLALTKKMETKFTGSTSSMSGVLQHFHFLLSNFRPLNHNMLSQEFPKPTSKFSKITLGPSAIFLRRKDDLYAIDADKAFDTPNIMSWLGHSLEKLLTVDRKEFERYRRSSGDAVPGEDESARCYHYSKLGNFLMRSQLDAYDPRLPGKGIFDLKTRAVVSIRMNHEEYEVGKGYQIRYDRGEWESYEREFYDMTRATMLKYSLQVRMGRMDGIFVAYHNVERIFGFQYLPIEDMDHVLHGQKDTCLGDQEFKMSISLLDELMQKATEKYPEQVSAPTAQ